MVRGGNSKDVGDLTELKTIGKFISGGYQVAIPFGDNSKYDLILDDDGEFYRVQCKTSWTCADGGFMFNTHSQTTRNGEYHETTYGNDIDAFAVYYPENGKLYWIEPEAATSKKRTLRSSAKSDHTSIYWAADYEFDGQIPG